MDTSPVTAEEPDADPRERSGFLHVTCNKSCKRQAFQRWRVQFGSKTRGSVLSLPHRIVYSVQDISEQDILHCKPQLAPLKLGTQHADLVGTLRHGDTDPMKHHGGDRFSDRWGKLEMPCFLEDANRCPITSATRLVSGDQSYMVSVRRVHLRLRRLRLTV